MDPLHSRDCRTWRLDEDEDDRLKTMVVPMYGYIGVCLVHDVEPGNWFLHKLGFRIKLGHEDFLGFLWEINGTQKTLSI